MLSGSDAKAYGTLSLIKTALINQFGDGASSGGQTKNRIIIPWIVQETGNRFYHSLLEQQSELCAGVSARMLKD